MVKIAVAGASGRMGRLIVNASQQKAGVELVAATVRPGHPWLGTDVTQEIDENRDPLRYTADLEAALQQADVLIDFTHPLATMTNLAVCRATQTPLLVGTTGFDAKQKQQLVDAGASLPIVLAANTSVGVNLCLKLLTIAAATLGDRVDVEIIEAHHKHKVDAPSGTALRMGEAIAQAQSKNLADCAVFAREGQTGARPDGSIGFATVRGGDIVGEHTVLFIGNGERIEITHRTGDRMTFAIGAVRAACWLADQPAGFFEMNDVLGL